MQSRAQGVRLEIFDPSGRRVRALVSDRIEAGHHESRWTLVDESGARVPNGLYFARFATAGLNRVARLVVMP